MNQEEGDFDIEYLSFDLGIDKKILKSMQMIIKNQFEEFKSIINEDFQFNQYYRSDLLIGCAILKGNEEIFRYLRMLGAQINQQDYEYAIISGNIEIINLLADDGHDFGENLSEAIIYHRNDIADWILTNYECHSLDPQTCLHSLNIEALSFCIHNKIGNILEAFLSAKMFDLASIAINLGFKLDEYYICHILVYYDFDCKLKLIEFILQNHEKVYNDATHFVILCDLVYH